MMDNKSFSFRSTGIRVLEDEISALQGIRQYIDTDAFDEACRILLSCKGKVIVTGMGKSGHIASKIAATMASTGTPSFFVHPGEASHGDLGMISKGDVVIAISNSGESTEILTIIPIIKRRGIKLICITGNEGSTMAKESDIHLCIHVEREACPLNLAPTSSTTATLAMGDALAIALLEAKGFTKEDFAMSHPGGALGRKLLLRNRDIMRTGDQLPTVSIHASVMDALFSITEKGLGMTAVTRDDGTLFGVFTDGDLRRLLDRNSGKDLHSVTIGSVTREGGITMKENELVAKAVNIMQERKFNGLIVTDGENRPIGAFNMHDVLQAGAV